MSRRPRAPTYNPLRGFDQDGRPLLVAESDGAGGLKAWCPACSTWHHHGGWPGHRVAHCRPGSPFKGSGYILIERGREAS